MSSSAGADDGGVHEDASSNPEAGASSDGAWSLTGTIRGVDLQEDARSAIAQRIDDGTSIRTSVTLIDLGGYCARSQTKASCPGEGTPRRFLLVTISGTTYPVATGDPLDPPAGEAGVAFIALGKTCELLAPQLKPTAGSVTFTEIDLARGGKVALSLDVSTPEGRVSGTITAPTCD